ncbi:MAG: gamma-glutamylcyclotransferase family protein [Verrucomicrobiales bacterium]
MTEEFLVFVYGTLRPGASNAWRMERARWLGEARAHGRMVKVDWYPGVSFGGGGELRGDLYLVDAGLMADLDDFEGSEYQKTRISVRTPEGEREAWAYEWLGSLADYEPVPDGDWLKVAPEA